MGLMRIFGPVLWLALTWIVTVHAYESLTSGVIIHLSRGGAKYYTRLSEEPVWFWIGIFLEFMILLFFWLGIAIACWSYLFDLIPYATQKNLLRRSRQIFDPGFLSRRGEDGYIQYQQLEDGTEYGMIRLKDGSWAKYWSNPFESMRGGALSLFNLSNGSEIFVPGFYSSKQPLPEEFFLSLKAFQDFINYELKLRCSN